MINTSQGGWSPLGGKVTLSLDTLHDKDLEVEEHLKRCNANFASANNGKGVNDREKIPLLKNTLQPGGVRLLAWTAKEKELLDAGTLVLKPTESLKELLISIGFGAFWGPQKPAKSISFA